MLLLFCEIASIHVQTMLKSMACQRTIEGAGGGIKPGIDCSLKTQGNLYRVFSDSIYIYCSTMFDYVVPIYNHCSISV